MQHRGVRLIVLAVVALALVSVLAGTSAAAPAAAPAQQGLSCRWERLSASLPQAVYFSGSAWDSVNNQLILNAGLDQGDSTKRTVQALVLATGTLPQSSARTIQVTGNQDYWGSAGAFRATMPVSGTVATFAGGATGKGSNPEGQGQRLVQGYLPAAGGTWSTIAQVGQGMSLAASTYDPDHDAVIVAGGVQTCDFFSVDGSNPLDCDDSVNAVSFITFNPTTGAASVSAGPNLPSRLFGATLVYDSVGKRALLFGGVDSASGNGRNATLALDLKDPDLSKARWTTLGTTGSTPTGRALHGAAYDAANNMMVVYGGVSRGYFTDSENALTNTFALDLAQATPRWSDLGANQPGERVGAGMAFASNQGKAVIVGGRRGFKSSGSQDVVRDGYFLSCQTVEPPTATATRDPNVTPSATATQGTGPGPGWTPAPCSPQACPGLDSLVPASVIAAALANPADVQGYCKLQNPGVPPSPWNRARTWLSLRNRGLPYNPITNGVIYKAGCP